MNNYKGIDICSCECHIEGMTVMHFMPCCQHCDEKYLDKDGKIIPEKIEPILRNEFLEKLKLINPGDKNDKNDYS